MAVRGTIGGIDSPEALEKALRRSREIDASNAARGQLKFSGGSGKRKSAPLRGAPPPL